MYVRRASSTAQFQYWGLQKGPTTRRRRRRKEENIGQNAKCLIKLVAREKLFASSLIYWLLFDFGGPREPEGRRCWWGWLCGKLVENRFFPLKTGEECSGKSLRAATTNQRDTTNTHTASAGWILSSRGGACAVSWVAKQQATREKKKRKAMKNYSKGAVILDVFNIGRRKKSEKRTRKKN